jgi:hypothetical protein
MTVVYFPQPKGKRNPERPAGSLLLAQVKHLREAEKNLPAQYQSGIFTPAIQTEGEAARYVRAVTEAIHAAHDDAAAERATRTRTQKRKQVIEIAAVADETAERRTRNKSTSKKKRGTIGRKK